LTRITAVLHNLPQPTLNKTLLTFEDLHQAYGFVLYRTEIQGGKKGVLKLKDLRDYAVVMINGKTVGTLDRRLAQDSLTVTLPSGHVTMDILVENLGRINFGKHLLDNKKGITEKVLFNNSELFNWKMYDLPFNSVSSIKYQPKAADVPSPVLREGEFTLQSIGDTYLDMSKWGKGMVWINGHNLGRYWSIGPQQTLYVPVEWLKKGINKIVVLELVKTNQQTLQALNKPILNSLQKN
jgi:beta-galactosidase